MAPPEIKESCPDCGSMDPGHSCSPSHSGPRSRSNELGEELVGQLVGGYRIERRIGNGAMGSVYAAVHPTLQTRIVIKVMSAGLASRGDLRRRFTDEAKALAALRDPHIVQVLDLATFEGDRMYIAMEFLTGEDLHSLLARRKQLPVAEAAWIALQVLAGLKTAHAAGIIHRDIKPANLMLCETEAHAPIVKILDFGVAKLHPEIGGGGATASYQLLGTPQYMAPEQAAGAARAVDERADLYAVGVLLYRMIAGVEPYSGDDLVEILWKQRSHPIPEMPLHDPDISSIVERALQKDPERRFAAAAEMADALQSAASGHVEPPLPAVLSTQVTLQERPAIGSANEMTILRSRLPRTRAVLGLGVLVALGVVGFAAWPRNTSGPTLESGDSSRPVDPVTFEGAPSNPPAVGLPTEYCMWEVESGPNKLNFGGPITVAPSGQPGAVFISAPVNAGYNSVYCNQAMTAMTGVGAGFTIRTDQFREGERDYRVPVPDVEWPYHLQWWVLWNSTPPVGFTDGSYVQAEGLPARLVLSSAGLTPGSLVEGTLVADARPAWGGPDSQQIALRMRFRFHRP